MKTKTVRDLLKLLEGIDPNTELWVRYVRDDNQCSPIVNLPKITTIGEITLNYSSGGSKTLWVVNENLEDDDIRNIKPAIVWNK